MISPLKMGKCIKSIEEILRGLDDLIDMVLPIPIKYDVLTDIQHHIHRWLEELRELEKELALQTQQPTQQ